MKRTAQDVQNPPTTKAAPTAQNTDLPSAHPSISQSSTLRQRHGFEEPSLTGAYSAVETVKSTAQDVQNPPTTKAAPTAQNTGLPSAHPSISQSSSLRQRRGFGARTATCMDFPNVDNSQVSDTWDENQICHTLSPWEDVSLPWESVSRHNNFATGIMGSKGGRGPLPSSKVDHPHIIIGVSRQQLIVPISPIAAIRFGFCIVQMYRIIIRVCVCVYGLQRLV